IALAKASGKIEGEELEKEHGKTIYSFDIRNAKGTITEVQVDAYSGAVLSVEEEDAGKEAAEKREDKMKGKQQDDDDDESPTAKNTRMAKLAKEAKITMAQAKEIALKRIPGTITEEDLEKENGRLQYSFDIKDADGKVFDVEIDAKTGKVLKAVEDKEDEDDDDGN
ncbi:MAG: PepSY domain-containing protein, partial [Pyrinomonadaceae bacterium]